MKDASEGGKGCFVSSPLPLGGFTSPRTRIAIMRHPNKLCPDGEERGRAEGDLTADTGFERGADSVKIPTMLSTF